MSERIIIDAHVHLWEKQNGCIDNKPVYGLGNGIAEFMGGRRQMMPPFMVDNRNTAERLIANMEYARVNVCVVTQEYMDGNQDEYLLRVKKAYPDRFRICSLYEENDDLRLDGFDGVKICAGRLKDKDLKKLLHVFKRIEQAGKFVGLDLSDGDAQTEDMQYLIEACPDLRVSIGHFGMVTTKGWQKQIALACNKNVYIESGGLTWLFHHEFYPYPSAIDAIIEARDICGMEKLMWGSDYPRTMTDLTYRSAVRFIEESTKLTEAEKDAFLGLNAVGFYKTDRLMPLPDIANMLDQ
ncbi:MAG: amidohydrolase [Lachnospiraceae bacterium]|nr:amidohydrolase [Lachnospiraceae bacterium]